MGLWYISLYLVILVMVSAAERNITIRHSDRRGKALKISKKPCTDPSGRKGVCTFKWDCINHNGTLMGTCVDGFIFGTCCQYDYDPLLHNDETYGQDFYGDTNKIIDRQDLTTKTPTTTKSTTASVATTRVTTTRSPSTTSTRRPSTTSTRRPSIATNSPPMQLVTWTSIGPTRRPVPPQRPIILSPFPFRPGINLPASNGGWPVGIAIPVSPLQVNRPLQAFRPQVFLQNPVRSTPSPTSSSTSFSILNGPDVSTQKSSTAKDQMDMTTISVPIPQWSSSSAPVESSTSLASVIPSISRNTPGPFLFLLNNASVGETTSTTIIPSRKPNLDYRKDCGVRSLGPKARIVGGQSSFFGRWPWQVLVKEAAWLGLYQKNKCGGVLISSKYAITAGHCQPGRFLSSLVVILGEHDLLSDGERLRPEMRRVKRMIVHRHYNPQNFDNDIALLELEPPVVFRPHISPICLPDSDEDFTGKNAFVTGWGKTSHGGAIPNLLQEVQVPIMTNAKCVEMFKEAGHTKLIKDSFVCAGYQAGGKDSCEGDSGGPLMVERESGQWVLVGTVSHGIRCADPNLPGVYMKISAFRQWIDKIIK